MKYVLAEWEHSLEDEPCLIYSELDGSRRETRRVEFYRNGITFSYGGERGNEGALVQEPFPEDLRHLPPPDGDGAAGGSRMGHRGRLHAGALGPAVGKVIVHRKYLRSRS